MEPFDLAAQRGNRFLSAQRALFRCHHRGIRRTQVRLKPDFVLVRFFGEHNGRIGRRLSVPLELIDLDEHLIERRVDGIFAGVGEMREIGFGGGEHMNVVEFAPGSAELDKASTDQLAGVSKALKERPQLKLDVPIVYSKTIDAPKTVSYYKYATTLFDVIRRSMPFPTPKTLTDQEVYALTAYLLYMNKVIDEADRMDATSLPKVKRPNRDNFFPEFPKLMPAQP